MEILKCPSCGAHIKESSTSCEYCGSCFPKKEITQENTQTLNNNSNVNINPNTNSSNRTGVEPFDEDRHHLEKVNWLVIAFVFMCFWPLGLAMAIIKLNKDKKNRR